VIFLTFANKPAMNDPPPLQLACSYPGVEGSFIGHYHLFPG